MKTSHRLPRPLLLTLIVVHAISLGYEANGQSIRPAYRRPSYTPRRVVATPYRPARRVMPRTQIASRAAIRRYPNQTISRQPLKISRPQAPRRYTVPTRSVQVARSRPVGRAPLSTATTPRRQPARPATLVKPNNTRLTTSTRGARLNPATFPAKTVSKPAVSKQARAVRRDEETPNVGGTTDALVTPVVGTTVGVGVGSGAAIGTMNGSWAGLGTGSNTSAMSSTGVTSTDDAQSTGVGASTGTAAGGLAGITDQDSDPTTNSTQTLLSSLDQQSPGMSKLGSPFDAKTGQELEDMVASHEAAGGVPRLISYDDNATPPRRTTGLGLNLDRPGAKQTVTDLGADYKKVYDGTKSLTVDQAMQAFHSDLNSAVQSARRLVPTYDSMPSGAQKVVADMVYNMGPSKFAGFHKMINALDAGDYDTAAAEMQNSDWSSQVGKRSIELILEMRAAARLNAPSIPNSSSASTIPLTIPTIGSGGYLP